MAHLCGKKRGSSPTADCRCVICDIGKMSALDIPIPKVDLLIVCVVVSQTENIQMDFVRRFIPFTNQ